MRTRWSITLRCSSRSGGRILSTWPLFWPLELNVILVRLFAFLLPCHRLIVVLLVTDGVANEPSRALMCSSLARSKLV